MGKPITQAEGEIDKSIHHIDYYVTNTKKFLEPDPLELPDRIGRSGQVIRQVIGPVVGIVPWNFPFWIPFKSLLPPFILGNPIIMKHSPSTPLSALACEDAFRKAGFDKGDYQNVFATNEQCAQIIADQRVRAVKFTGSTRGG